MPDRPPQDNIPQTKQARDALLRAVEQYVEAEKPVPPLTLGELAVHSDNLIRLTRTEPKYRNYISVLLNNAAWRGAVARVAYDRRLLLLPQCLRAVGECAASIDEFGLVCEHCGRCPIHELQAEAEKLGYVVLVAEGTAVVSTLVETGRIEAIVGVSCLSALERVFPLIEAAAIPGIAIPLLQEGCADTSVDLDWVWSALRVSSEGSSRRHNLEELRAEVQSWFAPEALDAILGPARSQTEQIARTWLAKSGKRWRPLLAVCAFQAFMDGSAGRLPEDLRKVAVAVECFHKASLVHDDIEDEDAERYGAQTLHEEHGVPVALNVGDLLLGEGYRMIAECGASGDRKARMLRVATGGHRSLCIGQGEELWWMRSPAPLSSEQVLDIFRQKTAPAFEVALRLGAIYAGAGEHELDVLGKYVECLGIAYQVHDDLDDFSGDGRAVASKLIGPSLLLALAYERAAGDARSALEEAWRQRVRIGPMTRHLERIFAELKVEQTARQMLASYKQEAIRSLQPLDNADLKGLLRRILGRIFNDIGVKDPFSDFQAPHAPGRQASAEPAG
jgi:geranylgeranyl diphosphate synthase type II